MLTQPSIIRAITFVDGQNLYHSVRETFGYTYPNYDIAALSRAICERQNWQFVQARFYSGIPAREDDAYWNHF